MIASSRELESFELEYARLPDCPNVRSGVASLQFWLLLFFSVFSFSTVWVELGFDFLLGFGYKDFGIDNGDRFLTAIGGLYALAIVVGSICWEKIYSLLNIKVVLLIAIIGEVWRSLRSSLHRWCLWQCAGVV
eukprot:TRINITY_DN6981_c0_g3_i1.p3 TRINITY_DN6981_c0_g3~~TRINITY_DN6981_c0_g3_i1.p3  ORF type:complete len:133 (-),score=5.65 TRINITY_DN6981_c0_g3_i1:427-825(-)